MRLRLALFLPARFYQDACRISKQLHSFRIAATNEHSLARRSWLLCRTPSWSYCVWCVCNCSLLVLFQCLVFFLTVKHQCNEVLPSFGIGVSSAKRTRWEISVFSCWQSIYLPSNVEYVCGMNTERHGRMEGKRVEIAVFVYFCCLWKAIFQWDCTTFHGSLHYPGKYNYMNTVEPISIDIKLILTVEHQQRNNFFLFPHLNNYALLVLYLLLISQVLYLVKKMSFH